MILSIDGLSVNSLKFLTTISHDIMYRTGQYIKEARAEDYEKSMDEINYVYRKGGFRIVEIHCDNEFHKAMDRFAAKQDPPMLNPDICRGPSNITSPPGGLHYTENTLLNIHN